MAKYKLVKRGRPNGTEEEKKWYATPISEKAQSSSATTRTATKNTSTAPTEMDGSLFLLRQYTEEQLLQGHIATIPYFGTMRVTFKSTGVENIDDFTASTMIKEPRIIFTPSKDFRESIISKLTFEGAGVIEDGVSYSTVKAYHIAKGDVVTDSTTGSTDSGSSDNEEVNPLG